MTEMTQALSLCQPGVLPCCISLCTVKGAGWFGRYYFSGRYPASLKGKTYAIEAEAIEAARAAGVREVQRTDYSFEVL